MDIQKQKYANVVTVLAKETALSDVFTVYWRAGLQKQGRINVKVTADVGDKQAVTELVAMQHVIEVLEAIGSTPPIKGLLLVFSSAAIRKVHANTSTKRFLYPFAYFLTTRFASADVAIDHDESWIKPRAENNVVELTINEPPGSWVTVNNFGKVCITKHVIDQFAKQMNNIGPAEAWKLMAKILGDARIVRADPSDRGQANAPDGGEAVKLIDQSTKWCFVIATNAQGHPAIATAYMV